MHLRPYQQELADEVQLLWQLGFRAVAIQLATGGGKTPTLSKLIESHNGYVAAIAHRDKLVEQMSLMLARCGISHDLIASEKTKRIITKKHLKKLGRCFYVPGARCRVASIDTLIRAKGIDRWAAQVTLWVVDECHHILRENKWGKGLAHFTHPHCKGLGLTATLGRPDGKGLGRHADGLLDAFAKGPPMRWLIDEGYLCDYDVVCPPSDLVAAEEPKGMDGDYTLAQRRTAERSSHIVGDVPAHYLRFAAGKSGITFCGSIETATETVAAYRARGVSAELITGDTDPTIRDNIFDRAEGGDLHQIVAVDVISEGVDMPALLVGSFARLTGSFITWLQQLGRLLRPMPTPAFLAATNRDERLAAIAASPKPRALLIDHIGGFINPSLGPPDKPREWSLDRREKRAKADNSDDPKYRICTNPAVDCFRPYEQFLRACPHCGYAPEPAGRARPEHVDGDLGLLDPIELAKLQGRVLPITLTRTEHNAQQLAKGAQPAWLARHWAGYQAGCEAQEQLRTVMDRWAGKWHAVGWPDHQIQRHFFASFGTDVLTAMSLDTREANSLRERIDGTVISR